MKHIRRISFWSLHGFCLVGWLNDLQWDNLHTMFPVPLIFFKKFGFFKRGLFYNLDHLGPFLRKSSLVPEMHHIFDHTFIHFQFNHSKIFSTKQQNSAYWTASQYFLFKELQCPITEKNIKKRCIIRATNHFLRIPSHLPLSVDNSFERTNNSSRLIFPTSKALITPKRFFYFWFSRSLFMRIFAICQVLQNPNSNL